MITKTGILLGSLAVPVGTLSTTSLFASGAINEQTPVTLGIVVACAVAVIAATWNAAKAFQKMTDGLKGVQDDVTAIKKEVREIDQRVIHIETLCPDCNGKVEPRKKHA